MRLLMLIINNFKGIRRFELDTQGGDINVYGDNATGKTTLEDAYQWLLFGKDSEGKSSFNIKTLDVNNEPMHGLEHEVEGVFEFKGKKMSLKKAYKEVWTKKRGSAESEFTGHTTDYYVDGVPVKQKEYLDTIAAIADEDAFKLLTNPLFFNTQLHWEKRRKVLLEVCGDISDSDVVASDNKLSKLPGILGSRTVDKHRDYIKSRQKEINKKLQEIPARVDEVHRGLPDTSDIHIHSLNKEKATLEALLEEKQAELNRINSNTEIVELQKQKTQIETIIIQAMNDASKGINERLSMLRQQESKLRIMISERDYAISSLARQGENDRNVIKKIEAELEALRSEWNLVYEEGFTTPDIAISCYACGQNLPEDKVQDSIDKAKDAFNLRKAKKLEEISAEGKRKAEQKVALVNAIEEGEKAILKAKEESNGYFEELEKLKEQIRVLEQSPNPTATPEIEKLREQKDAILLKMQEVRENSQAITDAVKEEISSIKASIALIESSFARMDARKDGLARIEQLKAEEKELAKEYEKFEQELFLTEEFTKARVRLLEDKINSRFRLAKWKLFSQQINGGINECCEVMVNGVPYSDLNNAMRINVGLDVINVLSEYYSFNPVIFVDNAEAVTQLIPTNAQIIRLVVSEKDKKLRVEHESESPQLRKAVS